MLSMNINLLLQFILGIAALIFLHELGHFIAARLMHVEVEEFGIGFPPRLVKLFEHNGTEYTLNWIPLGGFVRPKGENDPSIPGGLAAANPWVRLTVLFAGPFTNLVVGVLLAILFLYSNGEQVPSVKYTDPGSPAAVAGLMPGDVFLEVGNQPIYSVSKLLEMVDNHLGQPTQIVVDRNGQKVTVELVPRAHPPEGQGAMGVGLDYIDRPVPLSSAIYHGALVCYDTAHSMLTLPIKMLQGQTTPQEGRLVGYKGMYDIYARVREPIWFFSVISISLGLMNLLPIPALDGGRIFLTLPEILIRRRIPPEYETVIHMIGFAVLLLLLIYINLQDFINPLQFPN
jgi:regulator of sigma E protease